MAARNRAMWRTVRSGMRTRIGLALAGVALAGSLVACAGGSDGSDASPSAPAPTPTAPASSAPPASSPPPGPVSPTPPPGTEITLSGQVVEGVEAGCKLLDTGSEQYLLTGDAAEELRIGDTATVRGRERPDLLSTCQQGIPFEVAEVLD